MRKLALLLVFGAIAAIWWAFIGGSSPTPASRTAVEERVPAGPTPTATPAPVAENSASPVPEEGPDISPLESATPLDPEQGNWIVYRDKIYESLGLSPEDYAALASVRERFNQSFDELHAQLEAAPEERKGALVAAIEDKSEEFDVTVENLLGKEKFLRLLVSRDEFMGQAQERDGVRPSVDHSW